MSSRSDRMRDDRSWLERIGTDPADTREQMRVEEDDGLIKEASDDDFPDEEPSAAEAV